jgi:hypothetical protein
MQHINREYPENPYTDPKNTHPDIILDVAIPHTWESISYKNDVCPSFTVKNLQVFICDEETKKLEELDTKYSIMYQDDYGCTYDSLLNTDDWSEVLLFVQLHKFEEDA